MFQLTVTISLLQSTFGVSMDYSYLNQPTFDPSCSLGSMDLPSCQLPCSYADLGSCSQMTPAAAYRYSTAAVPRSFGGPSAVGPPPCGMVARPRHDQGPASVFSSAGMALQSEYSIGKQTYLIYLMIEFSSSYYF